MTPLLKITANAAIAAFVFAEVGVAQSTATQSSWVFAPSTYSHDPVTGARVSQYARVEPVEQLGDPRLVTSRFRRTRTTLRGPDGGVDTTYEVQSYANGRGGLDAEWERFHDAWRQSLLTGDYFYQNRPAPLGAVYGYPGDAFNPTYGPALPGGAYGDPRFRSPYPGSEVYRPGPFDRVPFRRDRRVAPGP
ncbi:MAG: hypothetical protein AAGJ46_18340 [Planctomycetota bacterium]